jgi:RNA polymerase sigma-70 factor (ECF subfamily)
VEHWYPRLYRTALRLTGDPDDAAEVTQEALCRAFERRAQFAGQSKPTTWLHRILVNTAKDRLRRRQVRAAQALDEWATPVLSEARQPDDHASEHEHHQAVREAVNALPEHLRKPLIATVLDGYSYQQAGELLGIPPGTVGSRVHKARQELSQALTPE